MIKPPHKPPKIHEKPNYPLECSSPFSRKTVTANPIKHTLHALHSARHECPKSSQPRALPTGESRDPASNMETWKYLCRQGLVSWLRPLSPEKPLGTRAEAFSSRRASRILGRTRATERKSRRSVQRARKRKSRSAAGVAATDCPRSGNVSVYTLC